MSIARKMKYNNLVLKRNITRNTVVQSILNASSETWANVAIAAIVLYVIAVAL